MNIIKFQVVQVVAGNAPAVSLAVSDVPLVLTRIFTGTGAPAAGTLQAGNGRYNGITGGFILAATLAAAGADYQVSDTLTLSTGTATTTLQMQVTEVDSSGAILNFVVSRAGVYTAWPSATAGVTGGHGSGAQFSPTRPTPDLYIDNTTPTAPVLYVCKAGGTNATSTWAQMSSTGGTAGLQQFKVVSDAGDYWICKSWDGATLGTNVASIYKPPKIRCGTLAITTETIRGTVQNYTYAFDGGLGCYVRTTTVGGNLLGKDVIIPDALANDIIDALSHANLPQQIGTAAVNNGGTSGAYIVGDQLTISGGTGTAAVLEVTAVSGGHVTGVKIVNAGAYTAAPTLSGCATTGGSGAGATFDLTMAGGLRAVDDGRAWSEI